MFFIWLVCWFVLELIDDIFIIGDCMFFNIWLLWLLMFLLKVNICSVCLGYVGEDI